MTTRPPSPDRPLYHGTHEPVLLGDRVSMPHFIFWKLVGVVWYVPGINPTHPHMEYRGHRHVGIEIKPGDMRLIHWPVGTPCLRDDITLVERGQPFTPIRPGEMLDPTA